MIRDNNCALRKCSNVLHSESRKFCRLSSLAFTMLISFSLVCFGGCTDSNAEFESLQETCKSLESKLNSASKSFESALNDAKNTASKISSDDVEDSSVLDNLNSLVDEAKNMNLPTISCLADNKDDIKKSNKELNDQLKAYKDKIKELEQASNDVQDSYRKHVFSEAKKIADDAVGKVKDPKVIDDLNAAIDNGDIDAIPDAVKAVNESIEAKNKEDEEARNAAQQKRTINKQPVNNVPQQSQDDQPQVSQNYVHPGAFCSEEGATGVTIKGTPMVCRSRDGDRARWGRQ